MRSAKALTLCILLILLSFSMPARAQTGWDVQSRLCQDYSRESALDACQAALTMVPDWISDEELARVYLYMGVALGELDRNDEAMQAFLKAKKLDPQNPKIFYNIGVAYDEKGKYSKALHAYRKACDLDIQMAEAWGNRGVDAYLTQRYFEARYSFDNALTIDPSYLDTRPEQRKMWAESLDMRPQTLALRREVSARISPMIAYMAPTGDDLNIKNFVYLMFDTEVDVQIYKRWFATGSFMYAHTKWEDSAQGGGMNIYAPTFGVKYAVILDDQEPLGNTSILNRSRYFFSLAVGPYITDVSAAQVPAGGYFNTARDAVDIGVNVGAGFDYYFHPNVGWGIQMKAHYVAFDENYFLISGGPHLLFRF